MNEYNKRAWTSIPDSRLVLTVLIVFQCSLLRTESGDIILVPRYTTVKGEYMLFKIIESIFHVEKFVNLNL